MKRILGALILAGALVVGTNQTGWAGPSPTGQANAMGYYLALGDSLAAGYQPGLGDNKTGGYTGPVLDAIKAATPKTQLVNLACSGETSTTMVSGGVCAYDKGTQLDQALAFLHSHGRFTRVVTVQIGANDVQRCVSHSTLTVDLPCVAAGLAALQTNLPMMLGKIRSEAPNAKVVVVNYYNPFLAAYVLGNPQLAQLSSALQAQLNAVLARSAVGSDALVADVAGAFESTNTAPTTLPPFGTIPTNVARICTYTWMCTLFDIHANNAGYTLIGATVAARLT